MAGVEAIGVSSPEDAGSKLMDLASEARWGIVLVDASIMDSLSIRDKGRLLNSSSPWFLETSLSAVQNIGTEENSAKEIVERMIQRSVGKKIAIK